MSHRAASHKRKQDHPARTGGFRDALEERTGENLGPVGGERDIRDQLADMEEELAKAQKVIRRLTLREAELEGDIGELIVQIGTFDAKMAEVNDITARLRRDVDEARGHRAVLVNRHYDLEDRVEVLERRVPEVPEPSECPPYCTESQWALAEQTGSVLDAPRGVLIPLAAYDLEE